MNSYLAIQMWSLDYSTESQDERCYRRFDSKVKLGYKPGSERNWRESGKFTLWSRYGLLEPELLFGDVGFSPAFETVQGNNFGNY